MSAALSPPDVTLVAFVLVYGGMLLGRLPGLRVDRAGVALLGALLLVVSGCLDLQQAWRAVDVSTLGLLFALMVVSAQLRLGGFYTRVTRRIAGARGTPQHLLLGVVITSGILSALLANDVVCLAMAPILVDGCSRRSLDPVPFLLALAAGANVGSAATLIGNPQNMLVGQTLHLSFAGYLGAATPPALVGLLLVWAVLCLRYRGCWHRPLAAAVSAEQPFDRWQCAKGFVVLVTLVVLFVLTDVPREVAALAAAGVLLLSRRLASRDLLGLVDGQLLLLFIGLFVVHAAVADTGAPAHALQWARAHGVDPSHPAWLFGASLLLSNAVSNVPAVMLLLPAASAPSAGAVLALSSTLAGNLLLVGSIANLIVVEQAARMGVAPRSGSWVREHALSGVPITLMTCAVAAGWLWLRS